MFIELVDSLRCLTPHEETWLVASVSTMNGRHIIDGTLGCPICRRAYPVRDGVGIFSAVGVAASLTPAGAADDDRVMRAAALLGLTDAGGIVVLGDTWVDCADALAELGPAHVITLNVAASDQSPQLVSSIIVDDTLPFAAGALRGIALGRHTATPELLASSASRLRSRGRLVAPAEVAVPPDVSELVRDAEDWVGERAVVASPPIALRLGRR
jgi:uncharacterized protein YbaR (Trm112 family)